LGGRWYVLGGFVGDAGLAGVHFAAESLGGLCKFVVFLGEVFKAADGLCKNGQLLNASIAAKRENIAELVELVVQERAFLFLAVHFAEFPSRLDSLSVFSLEKVVVLRVVVIPFFVLTSFSIKKVGCVGKCC
jgi:hypothetical protein